MTQEIFAEWFHNFFVPSVKDHLAKLNLPSKALLLIDNCSAHPKSLTSDDGVICCELSPTNATSRLQFLNCGAIEIVELWYSHHMLSALVEIKSRNSSETGATGDLLQTGV
jgi:hypothetical protein